jgi:hypothetical protein
MPVGESHQWLVVDSGPNPSTDFFVKPLLKKRAIDARFLTCEAELPEVSQHSAYSVVFVRYLSPAWRSWVIRNRQHINKLVYFMDDDLFDTASWAGQRWGYRWRLYTRAYRFKRWLARQGAELWVSSEVLADKYKTWQPTLLQPESPYPLNTGHQQKSADMGLNGDDAGSPIVFYHGSASHEAEMKWLVPVIQGVLSRHGEVCIEVIADARVKRHFSALIERFGERMQVIEPMPWLDYQQCITQRARTIGLAPLLDTRFNAYRAATKQFDIEAAQATGLFARHPAFASVLNSPQTPHQLLPMDQQVWQDAILEQL